MQTNERITSEHFNVPDGYFEKFATELMDKLPEQEFQPMKVGRKVALWPRAIAAVAVGIVAFSSVIYLTKFENQNVAETVPVNTQQQTEMFSVDDVADYAMIDHQDIYEMIVE